MTKVRFHLPGLRYNYPLNMYWINLLKQYPYFFRDNIEIGSCFGEFPMSLWNGGRLSKGDQCDALFVKTVVKSFNGVGVPVRYTYTNPLIEEKDLDDVYCNFCMKAADNGMNEVMVTSPILEEYIRKNYPSYKINSSICKEIKDADQLNAEINKDYKYVVLDYNLNGNWDFISKIEHPEKLEILVNSLCVPNCPRRADHYKNVAENERIVLTNRTLPKEQQRPIIPWQCKYGDTNTIYTTTDYPTVVKPDDIWEKYIPAGINNFKIEGRTANIFSLIDTYCHYMIKPEYKGEVRLLVINNLVQAKIINVSQPKSTRFNPEDAEAIL